MLENTGSSIISRHAPCIKLVSKAAPGFESRLGRVVSHILTHCPVLVQLGGFAFIGEGIPIGLGAAFQIKYRKVCTFPLPTHIYAALPKQPGAMLEAPMTQLLSTRTASAVHA